MRSINGHLDLKKLSELLQWVDWPQNEEGLLLQQSRSWSEDWAGQAIR